MDRFLGPGSALYAQGMPLPARHSSPTLVLTMFAVVLAALAFGAWQYLEANEARAADPLVPEYADVQGRRSAPISIVVFGDFRCRECAAMAREVFPGLQEDFVDDGLASIVFRHYPVLGRGSVRAAVAAECAGQQGRFWEMHDVLFQWQGGTNPEFYSDQMLKQLALGVRVNHHAFTACLNDSSAMPAIEADLAQCVALGLSQLPAVFVNGESAGAAADGTRIRALIIAAAKAL